MGVIKAPHLGGDPEAVYVDKQEWDELHAENERLRARWKRLQVARSEYLQRHRCNHTARCWWDEEAAAAIVNDRGPFADMSGEYGDTVRAALA